MAQIIVENLVKTYSIAERQPGLGGALRGLVRRRHRQIRALNGISFSLQQGELVGYIGPNGAGKSTTVKVLSGIIVPDSGSCRVPQMSGRELNTRLQPVPVFFSQRLYTPG